MSILTRDGGLEETWETLLASYVMQAFISSHLFLFFLLVAIAVDRFYAVTRPFDRTPIS